VGAREPCRWPADYAFPSSSLYPSFLPSQNLQEEIKALHEADSENQEIMDTHLKKLRSMVGSRDQRLQEQDRTLFKLKEDLMDVRSVQNMMFNKVFAKSVSRGVCLSVSLSLLSLSSVSLFCLSLSLFCLSLLSLPSISLSLSLSLVFSLSLLGFVVSLLLLLQQTAPLNKGDEPSCSLNPMVSYEDTGKVLSECLLEVWEPVVLKMLPLPISSDINPGLLQTDVESNPEGGFPDAAYILNLDGRESEFLARKYYLETQVCSACVWVGWVLFAACSCTSPSSCLRAFPCSDSRQ
jgi:hypothetical protein